MKISAAEERLRDKQYCNNFFGPDFNAIEKAKKKKNVHFDISFCYLRIIIQLL